MSVYRGKADIAVGAQVVMINADLLHFQFAPSASESRIGGVDRVGAKVAAQASVRNATMSKDCFIAALLFSVCADFGAFPDLNLEYCYQALVSPCLRGQGKMASSDGINRFVAA